MIDRCYRQILGVRFFIGSPKEAVAIGLRGGLVVVPAAPALIELEHDTAYRDALAGSDLAITDSGFMVLIWRFLRGERLIRVSGLEYLQLILQDPSLREPGATLWIMPTAGARDRTVTWLRQQGFSTTKDDCYLAPMYPKGTIEDTALLDLVRSRRPRHIIVGLGGGVQERVGLYLKTQVDYKVGIHCIGAAIGFLTGEQVNIPPWADYFFLGWFFRCLSEPKKFVPRYWKAKRLVGLMRRYGERMPALVST
jgi:UDP-N-acetyl-D-mannosaminuronic acid transferase (WecB/TagA/CpsF family)